MRQMLAITLSLATAGCILGGCTGGKGTDVPTKTPGTTPAVGLSAAPRADSAGVPQETTSSRPAVVGRTKPVAEAVVLRGDGLGAVSFGASLANTLEAVEATYGKSTSDTGWKPASVISNGCPGGHVRRVSWGDLSVWFSDGPTSYAHGRRHFFAYELGRSDDPASDASPSTMANVSVGQTVGDLRATYGRLVTVTKQDEGAAFAVRLPQGQLVGRATSAGNDGVIATIEAGQSCEQ